MHAIEPHFGWMHLYQAHQDPRSPFYGNEYSEFHFTNRIYNYAVHPQWENFGSETLLVKILFADYHSGFAILEFIGEWNDCINNDMMWLKREVLDVLILEGIDKFIFFTDHVLNFHGSDDAYYAELWEDIPGGWVVLLELRDHIFKEMLEYNIDTYLNLDEDGEGLEKWRQMKPERIFEIISSRMPELLT
jgi:hypothetical protein